MLGFNRWHLFKGLAAIFCVAGIVSLALIYFIPAPPSTITIAAGIKGGAFEDIAHRYRERLARAHVTLDIRLTDGALETRRLVEDPSSGVDVAFLFGGITNSKQSPGLMSLGRINFAPLWFFYRGTETLDRLTQLKGKRITQGPGLRVVTDPILGAHGVTPDSATVLPFAGPAAAKALKDGEVDVIYLPFELSSPIVQSLLRDPTVRLMSVTQAEALTRVFPFLARLVLPQGVVDFERNIPASDVSLIAITNAVLVRKDLHPGLVYLLAQTLSEEHSGAGVFQSAGEFPTRTDPEFPMAEGAVEFYKNGPPLLNKYLPHWIVPHVQRLLAALVAGGAIVFPLFSFAPKLFKSLVEYRLGSMYRRLREIEEKLQNDTSASDVAVLGADLASIDREISILGIPRGHSDLFFTIKSHIDVVRLRLDLRRAELHAPVVKAA